MVKKDTHFIHLPYYILANPIKFIEPKWKEKGLKDKKKMVKFLDNYKWVSFRDIVSGEKGVFSEAISKGAFLKVFSFTSGKEFEKYFIEWLSDF